MEVSVEQKRDRHQVNSKVQSYGHQLREELREQHIRTDFEHGNMDHEEAEINSIIAQINSKVVGNHISKQNLILEMNYILFLLYDDTMDKMANNVLQHQILYNYSFSIYIAMLISVLSMK